jgi:hypothetical protein
MTRYAVASAADGHGQIGFAREPESCHDVADVERPHDQLRVPFDHPVERGPRDVEAAVVRSNDRASMTLSQLSRRRHAPTLRDLDQLPTDLGERCTPGEPERVRSKSAVKF